MSCVKVNIEDCRGVEVELDLKWHNGGSGQIELKKAWRRGIEERTKSHISELEKALMDVYAGMRLGLVASFKMAV